MKKSAAQKQLLENALEAFHHETGLTFEIIEQRSHHDKPGIDTPLQLFDVAKKFIGVIKKQLTNNNLNSIVHQVKQLPESNSGLLVTDYVNTNLAERLKYAQIQFIDTAGNAYIKQSSLYIYVKGNKPTTPKVQNHKTGRAFQTAGLKVIFKFLQAPSLANGTYREIAEQADVALGSVGEILRDLIAQNFIVKNTSTGRRIIEPKRLLNAWIEHYQNLRKNYLLGTFTTDDHDWWKKINPNQLNLSWGGEIAAAEYTNYLQPKDGIVYTKKADLADFIKTARLKKIRTDQVATLRIDVFEPFWTESNTKEEPKHLAHPLIVYADLITTGDARNMETAQRLYEKFID